MSNRIKFIPPIELPDGSQLITLEDAGRYIMGLPAKTVERPEWKLALEVVLRAINGQDFEMHARMAFTRALNGIQPGSLPVKPERDPSKDHIHEFRNRKKRDPWR